VIPSSSTYTFDPVSTVVVVSGAISPPPTLWQHLLAVLILTVFPVRSPGSAGGRKDYIERDTKRTAETKADGTYIFENLVDGGTYKVTPSLAGYTFKPTSKDVTLSGADVDDMDFR